MKTWEQFFPDLLPEVTGCPEPVAEHALLRAAQEFFETTKLWRVWTDDIMTIANVIGYDIDMPTKSELVRLERATLDGHPIVITTVDELPIEWTSNNACVRTCIHTTDRRTVTLLPKPSGAGVLKIEATFKPSSSALGVEDVFFSLYAEQIAMGAKARLLKQHNKPYTDLNYSMFCEAQFKEMMAVSSINGGRGFSSTKPRQRGRYY